MEEHERGPEPVATPEPAAVAATAGPVAFSAAHGHACGCAGC